MHDSFRGTFIGLAALLAFGGCSTGGVTYQGPDNNDAGTDTPTVKQDAAPDIVVRVNLDGPGLADLGQITCTVSDAGSHCAVQTCGNGILEGSEECDDGNTTSGEGCTSDCKLETDWVCPTPGSPCISTVVCGDGRISGNEICDDHNTSDGDGCSGDCSAVEPGWTCPAPGVRCQPKCGDGLITGWEQCDDGNATSGDGCSESCTTETGYACPTPGEACHLTVCGDGKQEGAESCDDGNTVPGDGCTMDCKAEPECTGSDGCTSPCGDGLKLPEEECDDGNRTSGDGCSADCKLETGWDCKDVVDATTSVPVLFRDMIPSNATITDSAAPSQLRGSHAVRQGGPEHRPRHARGRSRAAVQPGCGHNRLHDHQCR